MYQYLCNFIVSSLWDRLGRLWGDRYTTVLFCCCITDFNIGEGWWYFTVFVFTYSYTWQANFLKCFIWLSILPPFCDEFSKRLNNYYVRIYIYHCIVCIYRVAIRLFLPSIGSTESRWQCVPATYFYLNILFPNPISNLIYKSINNRNMYYYCIKGLNKIFCHGHCHCLSNYSWLDSSPELFNQSTINTLKGTTQSTVMFVESK